MVYMLVVIIIINSVKHPYASLYRWSKTICACAQGRSQRGEGQTFPGWEDILKNQLQKQGKSGEKKGKWEAYHCGRERLATALRVRYINKPLFDYRTQQTDQEVMKYFTLKGFFFLSVIEYNS